MDIGLDVEAYKDYVNNLKIFAKYNQDYEVLADDNMQVPLTEMQRKKLIGPDGQIHDKALQKARAEKKEENR